MKKLKEIFNKYLDIASNERMRDSLCVLDNFVEDMRSKHPDEVDTMLSDIDDTLNPYMNEEDAREITSHFKNKDGTVGAKWSKSETDSVANKYGIPLDSNEFNDWDWFTVMNMVYSDHYHSGWGADIYADLAKDFLHDPDAKWVGKTKDYFAWTHKNKS